MTELIQPESFSCTIELGTCSDDKHSNSIITDRNEQIEHDPITIGGKSNHTDTSSAKEIPCFGTTIPEALCERFAQDGYVVFNSPILSKTCVDMLNHRLECILRGEYSRNVAPDKFPRLLRTSLPTSNCSRHNEQTAPTAANNHEEEENDTAAVSKELSSSPSAGIMPCVYLPHEKDNSIQQSQRKTNGNDLPVAHGPLGDNGNRQNVRVLQLINVHKADNLFRQLVCHPMLGYIVAKVARWKDGARVAQVSSDKIKLRY
jgi:hypothetical protein